MHFTALHLLQACLSFHKSSEQLKHLIFSTCSRLASLRNWRVLQGMTELASQCKQTSLMMATGAVCVFIELFLPGGLNEPIDYHAVLYKYTHTGCGSPSHFDPSIPVFVFPSNSPLDLNLPSFTSLLFSPLCLLLLWLHPGSKTTHFWMYALHKEGSPF